MARDVLNGETDAVESVAGKTGAVTLAKGDVGLGNVNNVSDANKPISTATQAALDDKADLTDGLVPAAQLGDDTPDEGAVLTIVSGVPTWVAP